MGIIVISVETAVADIRRVISTQDLNMANIIFLSKELDELNFIFITPTVYIICVHHIKEFAVSILIDIFEQQHKQLLISQQRFFYIHSSQKSHLKFVGIHANTM